MIINRNTWLAHALLIGVAQSFFAYPAFASGADNHSSDGNIGAIITSLGVSAVPSKELAKMRAGSETVAAVNLGSDTGNSVSNSTTGTISNASSVNDNIGLTSVMENTGNNSLLQSSMTVNITVQP
jgi:hypothetical protein